MGWDCIGMRVGASRVTCRAVVVVTLVRSVAQPVKPIRAMIARLEVAFMISPLMPDSECKFEAKDVKRGRNSPVRCRRKCVYCRPETEVDTRRGSPALLSYLNQCVHISSSFLSRYPVLGTCGVCREAKNPARDVPRPDSDVRVGARPRFGETQRRGKQRSATAWLESTSCCECKDSEHPNAD